MALVTNLTKRESNVSHLHESQTYISASITQFQILPSQEFRRHHQVTKEFIDKLGLLHQLNGHEGCVNCIQWSENGELLASGSDDAHVMLWHPFKGRQVQRHTTGHTGNIFSVKFMPGTQNRIVASGAADFKIQVHDMAAGKTLESYKKHTYRVKRMEVTPACPNILWSASEDGTVMETDIRAPPSESGILINLHADAESGIEAKCLSINPIYPEYLAVGGSDSYIRMYDRRKLKCNVIQWPDSVADNPRDRRGYLKDKSCQDYDWSNQRFAKYFVAGHLPKATKNVLWRRDNFTSTYVTFSPNGQELLANMGSEQIYLFDVFHGSPILKDSFAFKTFLLLDENPEKMVKNGFHKKSMTDDLKPGVLQLKMQANQEYEAERYSNAVNLYNQALAAQVHPILLGNRAAAYLKRMWNGDIYSALLDVYHVILLDSNHIKAHLRMIKCLTELKWIEEAEDFVVIFKQKFPNHADSPALKSLEKRLEEVKNDVKESESKNKKRKESGNDDVDNDNATVEPEVNKNDEFIVALEKLKVNATDFKLRFCGHCNTTTDIKEANFFGR